MSLSTIGTGNLRPVSGLFVGLPDTDFANFMLEIDQFIHRHPDILDAICDDLELHAKKKKKMRLRDRRWEEAQKSEGLPNFQQEPGEIKLEDIQLGQGRPRLMDGYVTFMFLMARGYEGGVKKRSFGDLLCESRTMYVMMKNKQQSMPAESTISENVNAVSNQTRRMIHRRQLEEVQAQQLDDFEHMIVDSTGLEANSSWPTDAVIITRLLKRIWRSGSNLDEFGIENFQRWWTECWLKKLKGLSYSILMADTKRERKKHYRKLYDIAENALEHLESENEKFRQRANPDSIKPSVRRRLKRTQHQLQRDLENVEKVISYSRARVIDGQQTSSTEKVLSLSDPDAAFIKKGDREPIIGYRPQLARSKSGFIGYLKVPEGNANDAPEFRPAVEGWINNTGTTPHIVSADDGYASLDGLRKVKQMGVEKVSISGAKGKRLLSEEQWKDPEIARARRERSRVESSIFTVKHGFDFDRSARTGLEDVRAEALEKVIAYNFHRAVQLKRQQDSQRRSRAA